MKQTIELVHVNSCCLGVDRNTGMSEPLAVGLLLPPRMSSSLNVMISQKYRKLIHSLETLSLLYYV